MITFLVTVRDDGKVIINKLSTPQTGGPDAGMALTRTLSDRTFETAEMQIDDRIDLHVQLPDGKTRRNVAISLLDDTIPAFTSVEEAEAWMESRQSGKYELSHG